MAVAAKIDSEPTCGDADYLFVIENIGMAKSSPPRSPPKPHTSEAWHASTAGRSVRIAF
jgi:hypothetical protein